MASIKYSPITAQDNDDGTISYVSDARLTGDNFASDYSFVLANGITAELTVDQNDPATAQITFLGDLSEGATISFTEDQALDLFESGEAPSDATAHLTFEDTAVTPVIESVLTFDDVTGDNNIDLTEQADVVELTGTADVTVEKVVLTFADETTREATVADGIWTYTLTAGDYTAIAGAVSAAAFGADDNAILDADGIEVTAAPTSDVTVEAPAEIESALTFDDVTGDNNIDLTEQADVVELTGTADATVAKVVLTFADETTREATVADGIWTYALTADDYTAIAGAVSAAAFDADDNAILDADGIEVTAAPTSDVTVDAPAEIVSVLTFDDVTGDNNIDLTEQADVVELTGTADATVAKVVLTFADETTREATVADGIWTYALTADDYTAIAGAVSATAFDIDGNPILDADGIEVTAAPTSDVTVEAAPTPEFPTIEYSTTALNEALANDGSISEPVTLTLSGDTFFSELAGHDLNTELDAVVLNLPEGLTATLVVSEDLTTAELTFEGKAINHAEANGASIQIALPSTYFESNVAPQGADQELSIAFQDTPSLTTEGTFTESGEDKGAVVGKVIITLHNSAFAADLVGTDLNADGAYVENVPAGLTAALTVIDDNTAELTLTGTAESSDAADSINDLTYSFQADNFESGNLPAGAELQTADVAFIQPRLTLSETAINDGERDGFADQTATITLTDGAKFIKAGLNLSKFVQGVPEGVTATLIATSDTEATLTLNGVETSFDAATLTLNLPKLAFVGRLDVAGRDSTIDLTFNDTTAPDAPEFVDVSDNDITDTERADGAVTITGTGEPGATIKLTFGTTGETTVVNPPAPSLIDDTALALEEAQTAADAATAAFEEAQTAADAATTAFEEAQTAADAAIAAFDEAQIAFDDADTAAVADTATADDAAALEAATTALEEAQTAVDETTTALEEAQTAADDAVAAGDTTDGTEITPIDGTEITPIDGTDTTPIEATTSEVIGEFATAEVTVDAEGNWSYDLKDTDYPANHETLMIGAVAVDAAGNESASSIVEITLTDNTGPVITLNEVTGDNSITNVEKSSENGVVVTGTTDDNSATVSLMFGENEAVEATVADGTWSYTLTDAEYAATVYDDVSAATGSLALTVSAKDAAGNESAEILTADIIVADYTAPIAPEFTTSEVDPIVAANTKTGTVGTTLSGTAEIGSVFVELRIGDEVNGITRTVAVDAATGVWEYIVKNAAVAALADSDTQIITAVAIDAAGNRSDATEFTPISDDFADVPAVALVVDSGADNADAVTNDAALVVTETELNAKVEYSATGTGAWLTAQPAAAPGANTVFVRQTDVSGNTSDSAEITFTFDNVIAPVAVAVSGIDATHTVTKLATLTVTDAESAAAVIEYSTDSTDGKDGTWATIEPTFAEGANSGYVRQTDDAGNVSVGTKFSFALDSVAPTTPVLAFTDTGVSTTDGITKDGTVTVTGIDTDATLKYTANGTEFTGALADGVYAIGAVKVVQTDAAGNTSEGVNAAALTVDTAAATPVLSLVTDNGTSLTDGISNVGTVAVAGLEAGATWTYSIKGATAVAGDATNSFTLPIGTYAVGDVKVTQTDVAGNTAEGVNAALQIVAAGPTEVAVAAANTTAYNAATEATLFNVAEGDFTYNIAGFGEDDAINFPAANLPTVKNADTTDGLVDLQYANNGHVALIHLSGLTAAQDAALYSVNAFNTVFGADTIGVVGVTPVAPVTPVTPVTPGATSTVAVAAAGTTDVATGNVQVDFASGSYLHTVTGFAAGDVLNFPDDVAATVKNSDFTDGKVDVQWAANGQVVTVTLTGLTNDAALYSTNAFNTAFGAGSII